MTDQPAWLLNLVEAVADYEDQHGHPDDGWTCLAKALEKVPETVCAEARGNGIARREAAKVADAEHDCAEHGPMLRVDDLPSPEAPQGRRWRCEAVGCLSSYWEPDDGGNVVPVAVLDAHRLGAQAATDKFVVHPGDSLHSAIERAVTERGPIRLMGLADLVAPATRTGTEATVAAVWDLVHAGRLDYDSDGMVRSVAKPPADTSWIKTEDR